MKYTKSLLLTLCCLVFVIGCKKDILDYSYDYRYTQEAAPASNVRLINLSNNIQLIANGDSLTNFFLPPKEPPLVSDRERTPHSTPYFPKNGYLGLTWDIPQSLFSSKGQVQFKTTSLSHYTEQVIGEVEFTAAEERNSPKDYYLLKGKYYVNYEEDVVVVPRSITSAKRPENFKIRIVNFATKPSRASSPMEDLLGPMTLTYADGTPVSEATSAISPTKWSEYVELPYGTYQFKILTSEGKQVPSAEQKELIHPPTSSLAVQGTIPSNITFSTIRTFQPGGVYTIVIHPKSFDWSDGRQQYDDLQNSFRILSDISEPQNRTFARVQIANALPGSNLTFSADGKKLSDPVKEGHSSEYQPIISGSKNLSVSDGSGKEIINLKSTITPGSNYTLWVYADNNGKPAAILVSNNLSGSFHYGNSTDNASVDRRKSDFHLSIRFLNLSSNIPYLTFTDQNGLPFETKYGDTGMTASNLEPGEFVKYNPYSRLLLWESKEAIEPYSFLAYSSSPGRVPGDWISGVTGLSSDALIARKELYTQANRQLPVHEPGIYSIALYGGYKMESSTAKFVLIKHIK